jgi:hypothetical protein
VPVRRIIGSAAIAVALCAPMATAQADDTHVLQGADFPDDSTFLTYVGCADFFGAASPPQLRINLGPAAAPLGRRSMGLVPAAAGSAAGPYARLDSLGSGTVRFSATSVAGTTGVSYVWYAAPDAGPGQAWAGRAEVSVPAGGWRQVDAATLGYSWTLVDLMTRKPVKAAGQATIGAFTTAHGDGPGYVVTGFGCDGNAFNIDALQAGGPGDVSTYDFEGLTVSTAIAATRPQVGPGETTVISGTVTDGDGRVLGDPLVLEARPRGAAGWQVVEELVVPDPDGVARAEVAPETATDYRWVLPESQYADAGVSAPLTVAVSR